MGFNDEYQKLRKKRLQQEQKSSSSLLYKNKTATEEDIAPVILHSTTSKVNQNDDDDDNDLLPVRKTREEFQGLSDGYQFGDLSKMFASTVEDFGISMAEGVTGIGEGILDAGFYGIAGIADKIGKDGVAEALRKVAQWNMTQTVGDSKRADMKFGGFRIDEASKLGEKGRGFGQGLGQVVGIMATGGLGGVAGLGSAGTTALTTGVMGVSSTGSGMSEAYESGATDEEAATYGLINGVVNAGSELLFGGLGKAVNALGISRGISSLDDVVAKKLSDKISNHFVKTAVQYSVKASAEGFEEVLAGVGQAVGKKLTYMSDEDLGQLIKDENLLEQFAMGAAISGVMQIPDAAISIKSGNDFITGMTPEQEAAAKDENTVVDSLFKDRVAEREKDGTKLTAKEKRDIRKQIERDLERGYISTDDIERILGGEAYKTYKNVSDTEAAEQAEIEKQIEELENLPNEKITVKQAERLKELRRELQDLKDNSVSQMWKDELKTNVWTSIQGSRLTESYWERARRGQAFEADLSKYDEKQAEIVKKAAESGILNNTNRTHEFVDMVAKISADKGVLFDFTNNAKLKESGFAVEGATVNGYFDKKSNTVGVNIDSAKALDTVVGHEITHVLEGTELYGELQKAVFTYAKTKGEYNGRRESLAKLYAEEDIDSEMTADLIGEYLFTDADFVQNLSVTNRNVFQKIYDEIKYLYNVVTAGSKEARKLEEVKRAFDKAYRESVKASGDTKYSLTGKTKDGIEVYETSQEIMKLTWEERKAKYLDVMKNEYRGRTAKFVRNGHTYYAEFDQGSIRKPIYGDSRSSESGKKALIKAGADGDVFSLVENSQYTGSKENAKDHTDADYFDYFVKTVQIDGKVFDLVADVEKKYGGDGGYVYTLALRDNKKIKASPTHGSNPVHSVGNALSNDIVPQNSKKSSDFVKNSLSEQKADSDYLAAVNNGDQATMQKLVDDAAESAGYKRLYYHGTPNGDFTKFKGHGKPMWITENRDYAEIYAKEKSVYQEDERVMALYAKMDNVLDLTSIDTSKLLSYEFYATPTRSDLDSPSEELKKLASLLGEDAQTLADMCRKTPYESIWQLINTKKFADLVRSKGYDTIKENEFGNITYGVLNPTQLKSADLVTRKQGKVIPLSERFNEKKKDIRYSLSDSDGKQLSKGQQEYFKDSKVRDENGSLKVMYHGTPNGDFTVFKDGTYFTENKWYADLYQNPGASSISTGKVATNPKTYEVYLNIKKPFDISNAEARSIYINDYIKGGNAVGINPYLSDAEYDKIDSIDWTEGEDLREFLIDNGYDYDGLVLDEGAVGGYGDDVKYRGKSYVIFSPDQVKNVDNVHPTSGPDIRHHRSAEGEAPGKGRFFGKDMRLEVAPVAEDVATTTEQAAPEAVAPEENVAPVNDWMPEPEETYTPSLYDLRDERDALREQMLAVQDDLDAVAPLAQRYGEVMQQIQQLEADERDRLASLDDADIPPEVEAPYYESSNASLDDPFEKRDIDAVGDRKVKAYMYENPEVKPFFQAEANILLGELLRTTKGERFYTETPDGIPGEYGAESYGHWTGTSRDTSPDIAYLLDTLGYSYADIEKGLQAIIKDNGAENNACSKRIEFILHDRLVDGYDEWDVHGRKIPPDQDYINLLKEKQIMEYTEEARKQFFEVADQYAPMENNEIVVEPIEDIAPVKHEAIRPKQTKEPSMKRVDTKAKPESKIAKVLTEEPQTAKKDKNAWAMFKNNVLDKGMVFEDLSLRTGNRELQARWNTIRYAETKAQDMIGKGNASVSSLQSIRETVESSGKTEDFYNYLYHKHNVDRMSLEEKVAPTIGALRGKFGHLQKKQIQAIAAKEITDTTTERTAQTIREAKEYLNAIETKNKPVFGDDVTAAVSKDKVAQYEKANPEFKVWAQDVYGYMNYLREMLVDDGVISRDTARLWAEMYPNYVPIRRAGKDGASINVPLDTGRTGINAPIKRAEGGNSDILPLFDTMAMRTQQTYRAIARNRFGVELKNTLGTTIDNTAQGVDDTIESIDNHDELLQKGKNGERPTFTVFENGERVTFEISEEMYDAMKPTSKELAYTNKVANTVGNVFRGLLTEYNPVFMTTNAAKDVQDILINSQHPARTYAAIPKAISQMASGGHWYNEYLKNGGEQNTYFDGESKTFKAEDEGWKKVIGMPLRGISYANNIIERVPRLAEYIASREAGQSIDVSMLDAARVTTNFAAGGDLTKALNRNGFTFLNASTQGAMQQVRNVREAKANGLKGWVQLAAKVAAAGLPAMLLNALLWDDDEDYEELSDYVKQNYYVVAKFGDGKFVRIPKGRTVAVIQNAFEQVGNALTGDDEVDLQSFLELAISNLAPNNPLENNILAPIMQVANNETWYGEDLVPTRLQDLPDAEQYDESTDSLSRWLGEKLNYSPYKINYLLNQYSGGVGDVLLPMLTPEAESGDNSLVGNAIAPFKDKFTTDSTMKNQNVSDFYDTVDELTKNAKSSNATDEDVLKYKYMNSVQTELSELYKQKREIQNSDLSDAEKYDAVRDIQKQINSLASESLETYKDVYINDGYATVGDRHYKLKDGEWQKISDEQLEKQNEVVDGLGIDPSEYWANKSEYDFAYEYPEKYAVAKSVGGYERYKTYSSELYDIKADKDENGKSITGSRKEKVIEYINNLDADYGERLILFKSEYNADDTYNEEIIDYLNNREDISYDEMVTILLELGFTVKNGHVYWD